MENNENTTNTDNEVKETMEQRAEKLAAELGIDKAKWPEELRNLAEKQLSPMEAVAKFEAEGMPRKEAMREAAKLLGKSRRDVYQAILQAETVNS